jgi:predicted dehydrogenase
MRIALAGTGFVADYYMTTLVNHPDLAVVCAFDRDPARLKQFSAYHRLKTVGSLEALINADDVDLVANLTSPQSHFEVSMAALEAGKHVYSEKPLAMSVEDARRLVDMAKKRSLVVAGAPANALSDAYALSKSAIEAGAIGRPRLVYAEMEDGAVFRQNWREWRSVSGAPWPGKHEFETGCTLEHAGYALTWLIGLFGPIRRITGMSGVMFAKKRVDIAEGAMAPDFSSATLEFDDGILARLTNGLSAPRDRSMTVMGEGGTLTVADLWDHRSAVHVEPAGEKPSLPFRIARRIEAWRGRALPIIPPSGRKLAYKTPRGSKLPAYPSQIDFAAGLKAVADCVAGGGKTPERMAAEALHVTEAALALNALSVHDGRYEMTSSLTV